MVITNIHDAGINYPVCTGCVSIHIEQICVGAAGVHTRTQLRLIGVRWNNIRLTQVKPVAHIVAYKHRNSIARAAQIGGIPDKAAAGIDENRCLTAINVAVCDFHISRPRVVLEAGGDGEVQAVKSEIAPDYTVSYKRITFIGAAHAAAISAAGKTLSCNHVLGNCTVYDVGLRVPIGRNTSAVPAGGVFGYQAILDQQLLAAADIYSAAGAACIVIGYITVNNQRIGIEAVYSTTLTDYSRRAVRINRAYLSGSLIFAEIAPINFARAADEIYTTSV